MAATSVVFVHGAGKAGAAAWPLQAAGADPGWCFLGRDPGGDDPSRDADRLLDLLAGTRGGHVVAHSYGANAALLAGLREPELVRSIALLEPACFDLARGMPAVEEHVDAMAPAFAVADDPSVSARDFFELFARGMGFPPPAAWDEDLEANAGRLRRLSPPWGVGLRPDAGLPVRSLVLTAPSSALYAETATALTRLGAVHRTVTGAGHRVQDDPRTTGLLRAFWEG
jgi:pimeloyl-ACP methyl ester carboxylesterase